MSNCSILLCMIMLAAGATTSRAQQVFDFGPGESSGNNFNFPSGAIVNVNGGEIGLNNSLSNGLLTINSGVVANAFSFGNGLLNNNNVVNLNGGFVGEFFELRTGTELNVAGGSIGSFGLFSDSTATITGGEIRRFPDVFSTGTVNLFGGDIFSVRLVGAGATANFFGSAFALDGVPIELEIGETVSIPTATGQNLSATLADGSPFEFDLNPSGPFGGANPDQTSPGSIINLTLTPTAGDFNADGVVDIADFTVFRDTLGETVGTPFAAADGNGDEQITAADFAVFAARLGETGPAASVAAATTIVPEPSGLALFFVAVVGMHRSGRATKRAN